MSTSGMGRREVLKAGICAVLGAAIVHPVNTLAQSGDQLPLIRKPVPSTGEELPVIGLGTNAYGVSTEEEMVPLREVLDQMPKLGGTVVDTAQAYGRSEAVIGELVEELGNRSSLFLATKTPIRGDVSDADGAVDASFRNLRTDRIDLLLIHNFHGLETLMPALIRAKEAGRVRYIGISTSVEEQYEPLMAAMQRYPLDFIQADYSIDNRGAADRLLGLAQERKLGVLINSPFGGRRNAAGTFSRVAGRDLPDWAADIDASTWAQVFLKYIVSHPAVTVVIPGTTRLRNLTDNQQAGRGRLPDASLRREIERYWDSLST